MNVVAWASFNSGDELWCVIKITWLRDLYYSDDEDKNRESWVLNRNMKTYMSHFDFADKQP